MKKVTKTILNIYLPAIFFTIIINFFSVIDTKMFVAVIAALILNLINLTASLIFYNISNNRSNQIFMIMNLGGMGLRLFFLLIGFTLILIFLEIHTIGFILVFLIFYSLSIFIEIKSFTEKDHKNRE